jgi:cell division protein FtsB
MPVDYERIQKEVEQTSREGRLRRKLDALKAERDMLKAEAIRANAQVLYDALKNLAREDFSSVDLENARAVLAACEVSI